jgi:Zn-dependent metalloprotease
MRSPLDDFGHSHSKPRRPLNGAAPRKRRARVAMEPLEPRCLMTGVPNPVAFLTGPQSGAPMQITLGYLTDNGASLGFAAGDAGRLTVSDNYADADSGVTHIYLVQGFNGVTVDNARINVNVGAQGQVINAGGGFVPGLGSSPSLAAPDAPAVSAAQAILDAAQGLGVSTTGADPTPLGPETGADRAAAYSASTISTNDIPTELTYWETPGGLRLTWAVVIKTPGPNLHWYDARVDAETGSLLWHNDWVDYFTESYTAFKQIQRNPNDGGRQVILDPALLSSSPNGWLDTNSTPGPNSTVTTGNNVIAYLDRAGNGDGKGFQPDGGVNHVFDFPLDLTKDPTSYQAASITNQFYVDNYIHDIHYVYGFTESAGNFQTNNLGKGGIGGDAVLAANEFGADAGNFDNAFFATPPDGQPGLQGMFLWDVTTPDRDGSLDSDVMIHESGHGVSNRLTGGPADANALDAQQSGGMGEGWSDFWAIMFTQRPQDTIGTPRPVGNYVLGFDNSGPGIRQFPYAFDMTIDPHTIADYNNDNEVHDVGEIWTSTLWDMNWLLIQKHGYNPDLTQGFTGPSTAGNLLALQLVMDGLKLQPANPTFAQARDAILLADQIRTGGQNQPEIWQAFARRGMGLSFNSGADANSLSVVPANDVPVFLTVQAGATVSIPEGQAFSGQIATFTDPAAAPVSAYTATISWGDDSLPTTGLIQSVGGGVFTVDGAHTYTAGGKFTVTITVDKSGGGGSASDTTSINVIPYPITGSAVPFTIDEGQVFDGVIAHFFDANPTPRPVSDYSVTVNWNDGTSSVGTVTQNPAGGFDVSATRVLGAGSFLANVTIVNTDTASLVIQLPITVNDLPLSAAPVAASPTEGLIFNGALASFTDADPRILPASNYSAVIDYGDGTTAAGIVTASATGGYFVAANHAFSAGTSHITVTVTDIGGSTTTITQPVPVADAAITAKGINFTQVEGQPNAGFFARFVDSDARPHQGSFYQASIDWGDTKFDSKGQAVHDVTFGTVIPDGRGGYLVFDKSKTLHFGTYHVTVTITDTVDGVIGGTGGVAAVTASASFTATITDAPITAQGVASIAPTEGAPFTGLVATFTNHDANATADQFKAIIDWGDGNTGKGTITANAAGGFDVTGTNTYGKKGTFPVSVTITDVSDPIGDPTSATPSSTLASTTAVVPVAPITPFGVTFTTFQRTEFSGIAAVFTDANQLSAAGDFHAVIDWGDSTTSAGTITSGPNGAFIVSGTHTFGLTGSFPVSVQISSAEGAQAGAQSTAIVSMIAPQVAGGLSALSSSGGAAGLGITNQSTPTFTGLSLPGAMVTLFAQVAGSSGAVPVGTGHVGSTGIWTIQTTQFTDGAYTVFAQATDVQGHSGAVTTILPAPGAGPLVVDTQGPKVAGVTLNPATGQFRIVINDALSGVNRAQLLNGANYSLTLRSGNRSQAVPLTGLTLTPSAPNGPQTLLANFAAGKKLKNGTFVLTLNSGGITDSAGNQLDERFFVPFPSVYNLPGQNYIAQFTINGRSANGPSQFIPASEVTAAAAHQSLVRSRLRRRGGR